MRFSVVLAIVVALQAVSTLPPERTPDLRRVLSNNAGLSSVEVLYSAEGQVIVVRGDGTILKQSTRQQLSLLPTCKGTVATGDVRHLLETILAVHFFELPRVLHTAQRGLAYATNALDHHKRCRRERDAGFRCGRVWRKTSGNP